MNQQWERVKKKAYPIVGATAEKAREAADELAANGDYDLIFVDLPGTVESTGVFRTIVNMDYVLTPTTPDLIIMQSTLAFPLRYSIMSETRRMCRSRISSSFGTG